MPFLQVADTTVEVDEHGYVRQMDRWNEAVAAVLAAADGVSTLTADHWKVIHYLRAHYYEFEVPPMIRKLCKQTGFTLKRIYELFTSGPAKGACKVAGLPTGKGCV